MDKILIGIFPGQGSQRKGMGAELFDSQEEFLVNEEDIDTLLGYSLREMCITNPDNRLTQTEITQPCLYVVNCLHYLKERQEANNTFDYFLGHSLGEYNALFAAGAFTLFDGLKLVLARGHAMSQAAEGGMAAIIGMRAENIQRLLNDHDFNSIHIANYNSPTQTVISGCSQQLRIAKTVFENAGAKLFHPLSVSAAFHSPYMNDAADHFLSHLQSVEFNPLKTPVISNFTGVTYPESANDTVIRRLLTKQIISPVRWTENIEFLLRQGECEFKEFGPTQKLGPLITECKREHTVSKRKRARNASANPVVVNDNRAPTQDAQTEVGTPSLALKVNDEIGATRLGCAQFKAEYKLRYAYVAGSMYRGIAGPRLVAKIAQMGGLAFLGTGGKSINETAQMIKDTRAYLLKGETFGVNFLADSMPQDKEFEYIDFLEAQNIDVIEASAFMRITPALVKYRLKGLTQAGATNRIIAKVSRPEVAKIFMEPAPSHIVDQLLTEGHISKSEAEASRNFPMAQDITVEADSGGHTDQGVTFSIFPAIQRLREQVSQTFNYAQTIRIGSAGGIGTPQAAASAFVLGADYILTGSVNQCTIEADTSDAVKDLLENINVQDTAYAPAGDMFEIGAKVQVLRRGVLFAARANKLHSLYTQHDSIDDLDPKTATQLQKTFFKRSFNEIWTETENHFITANPSLLARAQSNPKQKMALIFRWYFFKTSEYALLGEEAERINFQIHTGPALGALNQWLKGKPEALWRKRHVDWIAETLLTEAAAYLQLFYKNSLFLSSADTDVRPN